MKPVAGPFGGANSLYATTGAFGSREFDTAPAASPRHPGSVGQQLRAREYV